MKTGRVNFYFFGDPGSYNQYSPAYVCNRKCTAEVIYAIAVQEPFSISKQQIMEQLQIEEKTFDEIIQGLKLIEAIEIKNDTYRVNFPIFLEKDIEYIEKYLSNIGQVIGDSIIALKEKLYEKIVKLTSSRYYSKQRLLYHIICDKVFDGAAFDFFSDREVFCTSKLQPDNRDYIIVAFEDSEVVDKNSNRILCSSNNFKSGGFTFNSFGDSNGVRRDVFRFFRLVQKGLEGATPFNSLNLCYIKVIEDVNRTMAQKCGELMWSIYNSSCNYNEFKEEEKNLLMLLEEMGYLNIDEQNKGISINVPVFTEKDLGIVQEISDIILNAIYPLVRETFNTLEKNAPELTAIRHKVDIKEVGNELWHQVFGAANEYLAKRSFVEQPHSIDGQGRYLRSFSITIS